MGDAKRNREQWELLAMAAPILAIMAYRGGSLMAKQWVERARKLGITIENPDDADNTNPE